MCECWDDVSVRPFFVIFGKSQGFGVKHVLEEHKKTNVPPMFRKDKEEDQGIDRMVSFTLVSGKVREKMLLEYISGHIKQNRMNRNSQGGFSKEKTCLTKLLDWPTSMMFRMWLWCEWWDGWTKSSRWFFFGIGKASKTVFNSILINKLLNYRSYKDSEMDWNAD